MTQPWGKTVLITGAAMGMGKLMAFLFGREGARLALWDMNEVELDKTVAELKKSGVNVFGYGVDITDMDKSREARDKVHRDLGPVDILLNNAGIVKAGLFLEVPIETHLKVMAVNANAVMTCTYLFLPDMVEKRAGHIVNMASAAGLLGVPGISSYCMSKYAVVGFTETLRMELRKMNMRDIHTTTVCPSVVSTGMFEGMKPPLLNPMMTPNSMAKKIFEGVLKNKSYVKEPFMVKSIGLTKSTIPAETLYAITEALKVNTSMDKMVGRDSD